MLAEAEAPCAEQADGAQWFYLSFQCWQSLSLSSLFGRCLGIDVWNVMRQGQWEI